MVYNTNLDCSGKSLTDVPISFNNNGQIINLTLQAGTHGTHQNDDGSVQTVREYCLTETSEITTSKYQ